MIGRRFGRLVVIERTNNTPAGAARWLCRCDCGAIHIAIGTSLRKRGTGSCGCFSREMHSRLMTKYPGKHKRTPKHPLLRIWQGIINRCNSSTHHSYKNYGGRGISLYPQWHDFSQFAEDITALIGSRPNDDFSLDRIDNDGNY